MLKQTQWPADALNVDREPGAKASALIAIFVVAIASRLFWIQQPAIWIDEAFSIFYAQKGLGAIWGPDWKVEPTPPLFYAFLSVWTQIVGSSETLLRLTSAVIWAAAAVVICMTGTLLASRRAGIVAALLWLSTPMSVEYSVEIRAYALESLELAALFWAAVKLSRDYAAERRDEVFTSSAAVVGFAILAGYTHATSVFVFAGVSASLFAFFAYRRDYRVCAHWVLWNVAYALALLPQVVASHAVVTGNAITLAWLPALTLPVIRWTLRTIVVGAGKGFFVHGLLVVWCMILIACAYRLRRNLPLMLICVAAPIIGLALLVAFSFFTPALLPRTAMWAAIPICLLAGAGLDRAPRAALVAGVVLLLAGSWWNVVQTMKQRSAQRNDYVALSAIAKQYGDDLVVTVDGEKACIMQYYGLFANRIRRLDLGPEQSFTRRQKVDLGCNTPPVVSSADLGQALQEGQSAWLIASPAGGDRRWDDIQTLADKLKDEAVISQRVQAQAFGAARLTHK